MWFVSFLILNIIGILWASWICGFMSLISEWSQPLSFKYIKSFPVFLFLLAFSLCVFIPFSIFPQFLGILFISHPIVFSLWFSVWEISMEISLSLLFLSQSDPVYGSGHRARMSPSKASFISGLVFLISSISFESFLAFPSLCLYYPSVVECCPLFSLELLVYSSVISNSHLIILIPVIPEYGSDTCFVFSDCFFQS